MSDKASSPATTYSDAQKSEVVAWVNQYNADHGRGGQAEAASYFGVSPLTISAWLKKREHSSSAPISNPPSPISTPDIVGASWDRAREILGQVKLHFRLSICWQVMLGCELYELKKALGFTNGRNQHSRVRQDGEPSRTWAEYVTGELDLSDRTADRRIEEWEAAKSKLKKIGGEANVMNILETPASELTAIQRQELEVAVAKVTDGISQKELLEELKLVKLHDTSGIGGDTSEHAKAPKKNLGQLAFAFFEPLAKDLHNICSHPDRDKFFTVLAQDEPAKLLEMEQSLESALHAVRAAKARRTTGTVIQPA